MLLSAFAHLFPVAPHENGNGRKIFYQLLEARGCEQPEHGCAADFSPLSILLIQSELVSEQKPLKVLTCRKKAPRRRRKHKNYSEIPAHYISNLGEMGSHNENQAKFIFSLVEW